MKNKLAFTLTETLITLGIIGIISAIIIPITLSNYHKKVTATKLKTAYNILSQAIELSKAENGEPLTWDDNLTGFEYNQKYFIPYLKVIKSKQNDHEFTARSNGSWKPEFYYIGYFNAPVLYLSNGIIVKIVNHNNAGFNGKNIIAIDINGKAKPNTLGRDIFIFFIPKTCRTGGFGYDINNGDIKSKNGVGKLVPFGYGWDRETLIANCAPSSGSSRFAGSTCAAIIFNDDWAIKSDYPW